MNKSIMSSEFHSPHIDVAHVNPAKVRMQNSCQVLPEVTNKQNFLAGLAAPVILWPGMKLTFDGFEVILVILLEV